jgi:hypothetical protein
LLQEEAISGLGPVQQAGSGDAVHAKAGGEQEGGAVPGDGGVELGKGEGPGAEPQLDDVKLGDAEGSGRAKFLEVNRQSLAGVLEADRGGVPGDFAPGGRVRTGARRRQGEPGRRGKDERLA